MIRISLAHRSHGAWAPLLLKDTAILRVGGLELKETAAWGCLGQMDVAIDFTIPGLVNIQKAMENRHRNSGFTHY